VEWYSGKVGMRATDVVACPPPTIGVMTRVMMMMMRLTYWNEERRRRSERTRTWEAGKEMTKRSRGRKTWRQWRGV
jgi:DNA invertase Pin-like site-specific DNA recombinase